ncbi:MAG: hypothetical protein ACREDL_04880, partial [Bradyrhizobium sp.]
PVSSCLLSFDDHHTTRCTKGNDRMENITYVICAKAIAKRIAAAPPDAVYRRREAAARSAAAMRLCRAFSQHEQRSDGHNTG